MTVLSTETTTFYALFWPIFDAAINHKHHDFGVDKSERADYGHY